MAYWNVYHRAVAAPASSTGLRSRTQLAPPRVQQNPQRLTLSQMDQECQPLRHDGKKWHRRLHPAAPDFGMPTNWSTLPTEPGWSARLSPPSAAGDGILAASMPHHREEKCLPRQDTTVRVREGSMQRLGRFARRLTTADLSAFLMLGMPPGKLCGLRLGRRSASPLRWWGSRHLARSHSPSSFPRASLRPSARTRNSSLLATSCDVGSHDSNRSHNVGCSCARLPPGKRFDMFAKGVGWITGSSLIRKRRSHCPDSSETFDIAIEHSSASSLTQVDHWRDSPCNPINMLAD